MARYVGASCFAIHSAPFLLATPQSVIADTKRTPERSFSRPVSAASSPTQTMLSDLMSYECARANKGTAKGNEPALEAGSSKEMLACSHLDGDRTTGYGAAT